MRVLGEMLDRTSRSLSWEPRRTHKGPSTAMVAVVRRGLAVAS